MRERWARLHALAIGLTLDRSDGIPARHRDAISTFEPAEVQAAEAPRHARLGPQGPSAPGRYVLHEEDREPGRLRRGAVHPPSEHLRDRDVRAQGMAEGRVPAGAG